MIQAGAIFVGIPAVVLAVITTMVYGSRWNELWHQRKTRTRPDETKPRTEPVLGRPASAEAREGPIVYQRSEPEEVRTAGEAAQEGRTAGDGENPGQQ